MRDEKALAEAEAKTLSEVPPTQDNLFVAPQTEAAPRPVVNFWSCDHP